MTQKIDLTTEVMDETIQTLFHCTRKELLNSKRFFGEYMEVPVTFFDETEPDVPYVMYMILPLGTIKAKKKDWEALKAKFARYISEKSGHKVRPISQEEAGKLKKKWRDKALIEALGAMQPAGEA